MTVADEYARWAEKGAYPHPVGFSYQGQVRQVFGIGYRGGVYTLVLAGLDQPVPVFWLQELTPMQIALKREEEL